MIMKLLLLKKIISLIWKNNNDEHNKNFKYNNEDFLNKDWMVFILIYLWIMDLKLFIILLT